MYAACIHNAYAYAYAYIVHNVFHSNKYIGSKFKFWSLMFRESHKSCRQGFSTRMQFLEPAGQSEGNWLHQTVVPGSVVKLTAV